MESRGAGAKKAVGEALVVERREASGQKEYHSQLSGCVELWGKDEERSSTLIESDLYFKGGWKEWIHFFLKVTSCRRQVTRSRIQMGNMVKSF